MANVKRVDKVKSLPGERWKKVDLPKETNHVEYYISNKARIKSVHKNNGTQHLLKPTVDPKKYVRCSIKIDGKNYALYTHQLVAKYWSKKKKPHFTKYIHVDLDRTNNLPANVVWVSDEDWLAYIRARAKKFGFVPHRKGGKPKLTEKKVARIKKMLQTGRKKKKYIAEKFGVSHTQINRIESGENWGHVKPA